MRPHLHTHQCEVEGNESTGTMGNVTNLSPHGPTRKGVVLVLGFAHDRHQEQLQNRARRCQSANDGMGVLILVRSFADALLFESIKILDAISKASERQCKSDGGHGHVKVHAKLVVSIRSAREVGPGKESHRDEEAPPQKHEDGMDFHLVSI